MAQGKESQCDMILRWLQEIGEITPMDAIREFGCYRLGARIWDLKHRGIAIESELRHGKNRFGKTTSWAVYRLAA